VDVIKNGYWHAKSLEFSGQSTITSLAWLRFPADIIFIVAGVLSLLYAVVVTYIRVLKTEKRFI
jgi:nitric oxide reductase subunit B